MCYRPIGLSKNNNKQSVKNNSDQRAPHADKHGTAAVSEPTDFNFNSILGRSRELTQTLELARRFAASQANILITGETGTGKELFAQAIHHESRPGGPFVGLNCAAIAKSLIESELFGYDNGAFTGASKNGSSGKIELAQGGTLLLDEIGDMPLETQAVLLRVLDNKQVMRVGGKKYKPVDFRLIASTNKDLEQAVAEGQFRQDLYYRLSVLTLPIPPLRQRGRDIAYLAEMFVNKYSTGATAAVISPETTQKLMEYHWPGNVRQLENTMIYALNVLDSDIILPQHLPDSISRRSINFPNPGFPTSLQNLRQNDGLGLGELNHIVSLKEAEDICIRNAMARSGNNIALAAELLEISKATLYRKLKISESEKFNYYDQ